jgi:hypothetical protein
MKLAIFASSVALIGATFAAAGSAQAADPGKPLDEAACKVAWTMASPDGKTISKDKAVDYVINYSMVDSDADAAISEAEFKKGCAGGWIKPGDEATVKDMN